MWKSSNQELREWLDNKSDSGQTTLDFGDSSPIDEIANMFCCGICLLKENIILIGN